MPALSTTIALPSRDGAVDAPPTEGSLLFIGTATLLVRLGPFTLLTDPNFLHAGDHAHLGYGMTSPRRTDPALDLDQLPPLDACVLSHFHGDHWDHLATAGLPPRLPILTTHHAARELDRLGFREVRPLATWDQTVLRRGGSWLRIHAVPARHGPPLVHRALPPVMGTVWELGHGEGSARFRLYVSGDTLVHPQLREIPRRFPQLDVGVFHLGGTRVLGVLVTLDARQGLEALRIVSPDVAVPVHYDDYPVFKSPLEDFARAVREAGWAERVRFLARGERLELRFGEGAARAQAPRPAGAEARAGEGRGPRPAQEPKGRGAP